MADVIVEDGTGVDGADSYFAIAAADDYWGARAHDPNAAKWAALDVEKKRGAAREATAYLDATWGVLFPGRVKSQGQARLWPRAETDLPALPQQIIFAAIELAVRAAFARLAKDQGSEGWLKRKKTGPLEKEWGGPGIPGGSYGFVDGLLAPILIGQRNAQWSWR